MRYDFDVVIDRRGTNNILEDCLNRMKEALDSL